MKIIRRWNYDNNLLFIYFICWTHSDRNSLGSHLMLLKERPKAVEGSVHGEWWYWDKLSWKRNNVTYTCLCGWVSRYCHHYAKVRKLIIPFLTVRDRDTFSITSSCWFINRVFLSTPEYFVTTPCYHTVIKHAICANVRGLKGQQSTEFSQLGSCLPPHGVASSIDSK